MLFKLQNSPPKKVIYEKIILGSHLPGQVLVLVLLAPPFALKGEVFWMINFMGTLFMDYLQF